MELPKTRRVSFPKARYAVGILLHASQNFSRQIPQTVFASMSHPFLQPWVKCVSNLCVSILCVSQVLPTMVQSPLSVHSGLLYSSFRRSRRSIWQGPSLPSPPPVPRSYMC